IGGSFVAAFIYWLFHRGKKKTGAGSAQQQEQRKQNEIKPQQEEQKKQALQEQEAKQPVDAAGTIGAASSAPNIISNQTAVTEQPHFCSNCGAKLKPGSRFCENCGTKV
ncbi:MAG: zinc ribbon domain-containing protein, partial [Acidaminococcaceae bacterium]|nr:zinc ribbon domain-containing protein [Acidaminococcaceae bacterium]